MKSLLGKKFTASVVLLAVCIGATYSYAAPLWDDGGAKKIDNGITSQKDNKSDKKIKDTKETETKKDTPSKSTGNKPAKGAETKKNTPSKSTGNKPAKGAETKKNTPVKPTENKGQQNKSASQPQKDKAPSASNDYQNSYAKEAIDNAVRKGYAYETQSGKFSPKKNIQRYEFIYMVNRAFGFEKQAKIHFSDVSKSAPYYKDVSVAMGAGYMYTFNGNTIFGPKKYFYRWELPHLLGKAMKKDFSKEGTKALMKYSDGSKVPRSARASVAYFIQKGWMNPKSKNKFGTHDILTKEEMAYVLYQLQKAGYLK